MCTKSASKPSLGSCNTEMESKMRKKQVSFFERVKIREIRPPYNSSDEFSMSDDELDAELEYHMDLEKDYGYDQEIGDRLQPIMGLASERRNSLGARYPSGNNHIVDFSGKVYASAHQTSSRRSSRRQTIPSKFIVLPKMDRWQSQSQTQSPSQSQSPSIHRRMSSIDDASAGGASEESTISTTSLTSEENESSEISVFGLSSSNPPASPPPPPPTAESPSMAHFRKNNRKRLGRIQEGHSINHYFRPHSNSIPMAPPRRVSSTESLTSRGLYLRNRLPPDSSLPRDSSTRTGISYGSNKYGDNGSSSNSLYKSKRKTTSAPSLKWFKSRSSKNYPSLSESRNSTFINTRPPTIPSRKLTLLDTKNSCSDKSLGNSTRSTSSRDTVPTVCSDDEHTNAVVAPCSSDIEDIDEEDCSLHCEDGIDDHNSDDTPEKPSSSSSLFSVSSLVSCDSQSGNRRNLLQRGIGSLRSLTSKSPRSRRKGRNDLPPVRPIRTTSVRTLDLDDV